MGISAARNKWYSVLLIQEADFHTYMRWKLVRSHGNQISVEECSILVTLGQNYRFGKGKLFSVFLFPGIRENFFAKPEHFSKCFVTVALICANMARSVRCQSGTALKCVGKVAKNRQECCPKTLERSAARACSSFQPLPTVTGNRVSLLWHAFPFFSDWYSSLAYGGFFLTCKGKRSNNTQNKQFISELKDVRLIQEMQPATRN